MGLKDALAFIGVIPIILLPILASTQTVLFTLESIKKASENKVHTHPDALAKRAKSKEEKKKDDYEETQRDQEDQESHNQSFNLDKSIDPLAKNADHETIPHPPPVYEVSKIKHLKGNESPTKVKRLTTID